MITASTLTRLRACTASAVLPKAENHNVWADAGQDEHETLAEFGDDHQFAHLLPLQARAEVKLAYDVASRQGRVIGEGAGRDYGTPGPFEIVGSCDVLGVELRRVVILDWKTGFADVEPAATNAQLWFYALAAARALGKDEALVRIVYTQTGRVDDYEIDALELAQFASDLERLHVKVAALQESKRRGDVLDARGLVVQALRLEALLPIEERAARPGRGRRSRHHR
jgi:PD-(D/E)XK nuclease superfamily